MKSLDNQILKLLSNNDVTFFIPPYQRNYEWDEEMCEVLLSDIEKVANSGKIQHFFGTVIFYAEETILGQPDRYILVDGQQRLTTTMLFLIAVRDLIGDDVFKVAIDSKFLRNNNVSGDVEYKIKLKQVESDWDSYRKIILGEHLDGKDKRSNVFKNYKYFKNSLADLDNNKLRQLVEKGLSNFNIVTIQLEPERNPWEKPQEIFESMNSLGKPLSLADLVRNYLLLGKSSGQQDHLYRSYWLAIEKNLNGDNSSFTVSSFIRDYMQLIDMTSYKKATEVNYKELYREFKVLFGDDNQEELVKNLASYSQEYAYLAGYKESGNPGIDRLIADLKVMEASGFYSTILGILHLRTELKIQDDDVINMLEAIFIYIARRRILRLAQAENKNAPTLVRYFDELIDAPDKKEKMLNLLSDQIYALRMPNDAEIQSYLLSAESNFYNLRSGKFLFSLVEEKLTKSRPDISDHILQMEHIMPQTLSPEWERELGDNFQEIYDDYLNNIGNLTLIRYNSELSNNPFSEKKKIYEEHSGMQIAKDMILNQENWGEHQINERARYLIGILLERILKLPDGLNNSQNYSMIKKTPRGNKISFDKLGLVGKELAYFDDPMIIVKVIGDKEVEYEDRRWRLSPLTREIEIRKNRVNSSGSYWGAKQWTYNGETLKDILLSRGDEEADEEDE
ncbi:MAG: DUF262 domain-containing HNH endonuclease family protein [Candidatus Nomurabacteria bacterium]|nr:DUF262 domain-containing HNH endonuclease family protein [Candidatus Nomurabacteria bacterium]